ncbi:MAG: hypothetical protein AAGJ18_05235 [Bacteroidota bacterium]
MTLNKQILLLNTEAILLDSCDSLFVTNDWINKNLTSHFPFLESIFCDLLSLLKSGSNVTFSGVATKHSFLPGYYDYVFNLISKNGKSLIQWQIFDATDSYTRQKKQQQFYQESILYGKRTDFE